MVNLAVPYVRPNYALTTLQNEIRAWRPGREQNLGFISGYISAANYTGHNADANGIAHAYDIGVDIQGDGTGLTVRDGKTLAERLRRLGKAGFGPLAYGYVIHDRQIAGAFNGWLWAPYGGPSPHTDHIHISIIDLYYGDPVGIPATVYDSREPWNISTFSVLATRKITPLDPVLEEIMAFYKNKADFEAAMGTLIDTRINNNTRIKRVDEGLASLRDWLFKKLTAKK